MGIAVAVASAVQPALLKSLGIASSAEFRRRCSCLRRGETGTRIRGEWWRDSFVHGDGPVRGRAVRSGAERMRCGGSPSPSAASRIGSEPEFPSAGGPGSPAFPPFQHHRLSCANALDGIMAVLRDDRHSEDLGTHARIRATVLSVRRAVVARIGDGACSFARCWAPGGRGDCALATGA